MPPRKHTQKRKHQQGRNKKFRWMRPTKWGRETMPSTLWTKFKYAEQISVTSTTGTPNGYLFRTTSLFDPNYTGTGHQPYLHDQLALIYRNYCCIGCKVIFRFTATSNAKVTLRASSNNSTPIDLELEEERSYVKTKMVNEHNIGVLSLYVSNPKVRGVSKNAYLAEGDNLAAFGANPTNNNYVAICVQHPDQASSVTLLGNVHLEYYVRVSDRLAVNQS